MHHKHIKQSNESDIFGFCFSGNISAGLNLSQCFITLEMNIKAGLEKKEEALWASFQRCSCITSPKAHVSVPGPSLKISHCHSLLSWKGSPELCPATSAYFYPLASLPPSPLAASFSIPASLFSPTQLLFIPTSGS